MWFCTIVGASFLADSVERVVLASASTLSASVARTLKSGEGLSKLSSDTSRIEPQSISAARVRLSAAPLCKGGTQGVRGGVEVIGVGSQQRNVAGSQARKEDRVRTVVGANQSLVQENPPYTPTVHEFAGG